jgi:hypothetical protein
MAASRFFWQVGFLTIIHSLIGLCQCKSHPTRGKSACPQIGDFIWKKHWRSEGREKDIIGSSTATQAVRASVILKIREGKKERERECVCMCMREIGRERKGGRKERREEREQKNFKLLVFGYSFHLLTMSELL